MSFFLGDPENQGHDGGHDDLAEKMSEHAAEFARKYWRWQDMQAYVRGDLFSVSADAN